MSAGILLTKSYQNTVFITMKISCNIVCAGTVVTYLKDGFHIDIEIAGKIMSFSYICIIIFISNISFPVIVRTDMEINLKPLTRSNSFYIIELCCLYFHCDSLMCTAYVW